MNPALLAMFKTLFGDKVEDVFKMIDTMRNGVMEVNERLTRIENRLAAMEAKSTQGYGLFDIQERTNDERYRGPDGAAAIVGDGTTE